MKPDAILESVQFQNLLTFGYEAEPVVLDPLNVLIGSNGAGKSNFLNLLGLFGSTVKDLQGSVLAGGGGPEWIHKSSKPGSKIAIRSAVKIIEDRFEHFLALREVNGRLIVDLELVTVNSGGSSGNLLLRSDPRGGWAKHGTYQDGKLGYETDDDSELADRGYQRVTRQNFGNSVLSEIGHLSGLAGLDKLRTFYEGFRSYGALDFGPNGPARAPHPMGDNENQLLPDLSNLMNVVVGIRRFPERLDSIVAHLRIVNPRIEGVDIDSAGNYVQLVFKEEGRIRTPASRLSEGTLRFLAILVAIHQPSAPTVLCLEEPETGLHPDAMGELARVLRDASSRMQVVVTTHSEKLVSTFTNRPEAIMTSDIDERGTHLRRLESAGLAHWLEKYSLGDLWESGHIGGVL